MKIIISVTSFLLLVAVSLLQAQTGLPLIPPNATVEGWQIQETGTTSNFHDIFFISKDTGWASCGMGLFRTTDGGTHWELSFQKDDIQAARFIDGKNGWVLTSINIYRTTDGGKFFTPITSPILGTKLQIFGMDTVYILSTFNSMFAQSTNRGQTWTTIQIPGPSAAMSFANSQVGYISGDETMFLDPPPPPNGHQGEFGAAFSKTTDGGLSWKQLYCNVDQHPANFDCLVAIDSQVLFGTQRSLIRSKNSGTTWDTIEGTDAKFKSLCFPNKKIGYWVGDFGKIGCSTDSGNTWFLQSSPITTKLLSTYFIDSTTGWACGEEGVILHTTSGGFSSVQSPQKNSFHLELSPNPATESLGLSYTLPLLQHTTIQVIDLAGNMVLTPIINMVQTGMQTLSIDIHSLPSGIYFLQLQTEQYNMVKHFSVVR